MGSQQSAAIRSQKMKVGISLVITLVLVVVGAAFITSWQREDEIPYTVVFQGSVLGLNEGGVVHYMGMEAGRVKNIWVCEDDQLAHVDVLIEPTKITLQEGVEARLEYYSLATGAMCIGLYGGMGPPLEPESVIQAVPSTLESAGTRVSELADRIEAEVDKLSKAFDGLEDGQFTRMAERVDGIFEEINVALEGMEEGDFARTMDNFDAILAKVDSGFEGLEEGEFAQTAEDMDAIIGQIRAGLVGIEEQKMRTLLADAGGVVRRVRSMLEAMDDNEFPETVAQIRDLLESGETTFAETQVAVNETSDRLLHNTENMQHDMTNSLRALNETLESISTTADHLDKDPSAIVRGKTKPRPRDMDRREN
jgi:ABC-type transporter Mla subunit MlaD